MHTVTHKHRHTNRHTDPNGDAHRNTDRQAQIHTDTYTANTDTCILNMSAMLCL